MKCPASPTASIIARTRSRRHDAEPMPRTSSGAATMRAMRMRGLSEE